MLRGLPLCGVRDVHPNPEEHRGHGGGTAVRGDGVRVFRQVSGLGAGSGKVALSRPAWLSSLSRHTSTPKGHAGHNANRWAAAPRYKIKV